jgi:hypothetical protein
VGALLLPGMLLLLLTSVPDIENAFPLLNSSVMPLFRVIRGVKDSSVVLLNKLAKSYVLLINFRSATLNKCLLAS